MYCLLRLDDTSAITNSDEEDSAESSDDEDEASAVSRLVDQVQLAVPSDRLGYFILERSKLYPLVPHMFLAGHIWQKTKIIKYWEIFEKNINYYSYN